MKPKRDAKHQRIFESLVNMLGEENVSDDPAAMLAYSRDWMPDSTRYIPNETVKYLYETAGTHTLNFIVTQKEGCIHSVSVPVEVIASPELDVYQVEGAYCGNDDGKAVVDIMNRMGTTIQMSTKSSTEETVDGKPLGFKQSVKF